MRIESDVKLDFKDVLLRPKRSTLGSRANVDLARQYSFRHARLAMPVVPLIAANMDTVGTFEMARALSAHKILTAVHKHYPVDELVTFFSRDDGPHGDSASDPASNPASDPASEPGAMAGGKAEAGANDYAFYSLGILDCDLEKFDQVWTGCNGAIRWVCIDVANGYTEAFMEFVKRFRERYPDLVLMAGNVVTADMTEALILAGVDIVKVGIGPGSVCTTRKMTGVGYPQLSAIIECADAAHGLGGRICGDGGCTVPGDVVKAFGGGADFVMLGGMLAAHDESGGEVIEHDGATYRKFYGMSSEEAMTRYAGGVAKYRASEGKSTMLPARGPVDTTVQDILGGLRSACTYVGARKLKDLSRCTTFVRVTQQINEVFGVAN